MGDLANPRVAPFWCFYPVVGNEHRTFHSFFLKGGPDGDAGIFLAMLRGDLGGEARLRLTPYGEMYDVLGLGTGIRLFIDDDDIFSLSAPVEEAGAIDAIIAHYEEQVRHRRVFGVGAIPGILRPAMVPALFDDLGVRFEYPVGWEVDVSDDGPRATVAVQAPSGLAFALVTLDADRPAPAELVDEALAAMKEEYPTLEAMPALETIDGQKAIGHDVEFVSLDVPNACAIRAYRTPRRTVLLFAQWSELNADDEEDEDPESLLLTLRRTLEETDS